MAARAHIDEEGMTSMDTARADTVHFETTDLTPLIGTEVSADLDGLLSGRYAKQIRMLLERRGMHSRKEWV
jgi:hypothetical protein